MSIKFTVTLPDEPYTNTTDLNKTIECTYVANRYVVVGYDINTGVVTQLGGDYSSVDDIDMSSYFDSGVAFVILDAAVNTEVAAYLTGRYENPALDPFEELLPNGETYTFPYEENGILETTYEGSVTYDPGTKTYNMPPFQSPAVAREDIKATFSDRLEDAEEALAKELTDEELAQVNSFKEFYTQFDEVWGSVDHWKIPFPTLPK